VESAARGYLAGYPVVDFKVTVFDGSYHDVDSNEIRSRWLGAWRFANAWKRQAMPAGTDHEGRD